MTVDPSWKPEGEGGAASLPPHLSTKLQNLPDQPGVYLMKDARGQVIYVGKAISLRNRVRSYFQKGAHPPKVAAMVARVADLEYIVTDSEKEAFILEYNLIKEYRPWYNIRLRDDKSYPYLKVTVNEPFPRLFVVRRPKDDGSRCYGPYTNLPAMHLTLDLLQRLFPLRTCRKQIEPGGRRERPCLNYHIKRCYAPCAGKISPAEYRELVEKACLVLEGKEEELARTLEAEMRQAAEALEFERAARLRDQLAAIREVTEKQKVATFAGGDRDVIGMAQGEKLTSLQVFFYREGRLVGREPFILETGEQLGDTPAEILTAFLTQFYAAAGYIPPEILLPAEPADMSLVAGWLSERRGRKAHLLVPQRGERRELVAMANKNAAYFLEQEELTLAQRRQGEETVLQELRETLGLPRLPWRIEGYDISNIQGSEPVGSMVVFEGGKPARGEYRHFKIRGVEGPNDFAMLAEMVRRRFVRGLAEQEELRQAQTAGHPGVNPSGSGEAKMKAHFAHFPDLLLIDGGKGQLAAVREVLTELGLGELPAIGLAKEFEEIYQEGRSEPLRLPRESAALTLLQRIRDEAHRFALTHHRGLRDKRTTASSLDAIPGVGAARKKALLRHFGSPAAIRQASREELARVPGISTRLAEEIYAHFHRL